MSSKHWLLRVPETLAGESGWSWRNAAGGQRVQELQPDQDSNSGIDEQAGHGSLADFAAVVMAAARQPVVALLPVTCALAVPVIVPQRQQRQLLAALPFLLEETLAADIERFHVIAGARIDVQKLQSVAIERIWLQSALTMMQAAGIDPDIVTVDALALPSAGTLFLDGTHSLLRAHDGHAASFDAQDAAIVVSAQALPDGCTLHVLCGPNGDESVARAVETEMATRENAPAVQVDEGRRDLLDILCSRTAGDWALVPNLRQGAFAKTGSGEFSLGFDWRPLAWLAACFAVVSLGYQLAVGVSYSRAAGAVQVAQVELYKQIFPGSANVPRPRQQMEGQLGDSGASEGLFVSLVARTSDAFTELGGEGAGYRPGSLAWDGEQHQLRIDVMARSLEDLDKLRETLQQKGLAVDIGAGIAQDGGYKARMNVGEGA